MRLVHPAYPLVTATGGHEMVPKPAPVARRWRTAGEWEKAAGCYHGARHGRNPSSETEAVFLSSNPS
jgi:hypothetical protein